MRKLVLAVFVVTLALLLAAPGHAQLFSPTPCMPSEDEPSVVIDNQGLPEGRWYVYGCDFHEGDRIRIEARLNLGLGARDQGWLQLDPVEARFEEDLDLTFLAEIAYRGDRSDLRGGYLLKVTVTDESGATATELRVIDKNGELTHDPRVGTATKTFQLTLRGDVPEGEMFVVAMDAEDINHESLIMFCGKDPSVDYADSGKTCEGGKTYTATRTFPKGTGVNFAYSNLNDETFFGCHEIMLEDSIVTAIYTYGPNGGRGKGECGSSGREAKQPDEEREVSASDDGRTKVTTIISSTNPAPECELILTVRVERGGGPLAGASVRAMTAYTTTRSVETDADGLAKLRLEIGREPLGEQVFVDLRVATGEETFTHAGNTAFTPRKGGECDNPDTRTLVKQAEVLETPHPTGVSQSTPVPAQAPRPSLALESKASTIGARFDTDQSLVMGSLVGAASLLVAIGYVVLWRH